MDQKHFKLLLGNLDPEPENAGEKYVFLHSKIVFLVERERHLSSKAEEIADETLNRVGKKIEDKIKKREQIDNINGYAYMVFRYVLKEFRRKFPPEDELPPDIRDEFEPENESDPPLDCLDKCLEEDLSKKALDLILSYYDPHADRKKLAGDLHIEPNYLKLKAYKIRQRLRKCIGKCMKKQSVTETADPDTSKQEVNRR
jgi:hypothetical protein